MTSQATATAIHKPHVVQITVNDHPVSMTGRKATGLAIKETAIAQGVDIEPDFVLSVELGHGRTRIVGDTDVVHLRKGQHFIAIPNDDNS
jgi:hypothetical protein